MFEGKEPGSKKTDPHIIQSNDGDDGAGDGANRDDDKQKSVLTTSNLKKLWYAL